MIDLKAGTITLNEKTSKIIDFKVFFVGVDGLHSSLKDALADCERNGIESNMLRAVPVAIDQAERYEIIMR